MESDRDLLNVGATIVLDSFTGDLVEELEAAGLPAIVLKGPAVARLLYRDGTLRFHDDVDLLVRDADLPKIRTVLVAGGFNLAAEAESGEVWARTADGIVVDLHTTLIGIGAPKDKVWNVLSSDRAILDLGSHAVQTLTPAGIALHVALHAAQHGAGTGRSLADLDRALAVFDRPTWREAAALARELEADVPMGTGLRLLPDGEVLAEELGLSDEQSALLALRASTAPVGAMGLYRLFEARGIREKGALLRRELVPQPAFMRQMYPIARRGPVGLLASYAWRPIWLLAHALPAIVALVRARRMSR
jgi:hypothetical protein